MSFNTALILIVLSDVLVLLIGIAVGYLVKRYQVKAAMDKEQAEAGSAIARAREEARETKLQAENEARLRRNCIPVNRPAGRIEFPSTPGSAGRPRETNYPDMRS